ncbi:MAG: hypothetical protein CMK96_00295 [Pseudomonas sp.]|jgi:lysylphosphatidylglycerol synthetase-like protein (DUF2156 family)|nr:hypothetical protein [Pseudomonadales bacterium]MAK85403.1 hypothetical protein [Pseudomonas sp.]HCH76753.1 hypothetical protein [Pseudomonas sp.]|tara:strand:- start:2739 stop:2993 length:255 start_codon:yes stop_codon:yes gene_type:complete
MSVFANSDEDKRQSIARTLGFFTASEVALLAGVKESTLCAWRKRQTGPCYVWFGNQPLYSLEALKTFLAKHEAKEDRRHIIDAI